MTWFQHEEGWLYAYSAVWHEEGSPSQYTVECEHEGNWIGQMEGHTLHRGELVDCLAACQQAEDGGIQDQQRRKRGKTKKAR